jgi:hypothetical protein
VWWLRHTWVILQATSSISPRCSGQGLGSTQHTGAHCITWAKGQGRSRYCNNVAMCLVPRNADVHFRPLPYCCRKDLQRGRSGRLRATSLLLKEGHAEWLPHRRPSKLDHICGQVVTVPAYRCRGPSSTPSAAIFSEK